MVTTQRTLRDVERLGKLLVCRQRFGITGSPSDTTLHRIVCQLNPSEVRGVLHRSVLRMKRAKMLPKDPALGFHQAAIDGKLFSSDPKRLHPDAQYRSNGDSTTYMLHALRAVLVSTPVAPNLDQLVLPRGKGEVTMFQTFLQTLLSVYGRDLIEVVSMDAGFCNFRDLQHLATLGVGFVVGLKGNWPSLHGYARRSLGEGDTPPPMGWERVEEEKRGGQRIRRSIARFQPKGGIEYGAILELWRVRKEVRSKHGTTVEDRFFAVRPPPGRSFSASSALAAVRAHWGIENKSNWVADAIWREDDRAWVRQGYALETLALMRLIAINVVRAYRCRALRSKKNRHRPFAEIIELLFVALVRPDVWRCVPV